MYDNLYGDGVSSAISFTCLHGGGPPTNATATPILRNITVKNMALTGVVGDNYGVNGRSTCAYIQTLEESPIDGLYLDNISITGSCNAAFSCGSLTKKVCLLLLLLLPAAAAGCCWLLLLAAAAAAAAVVTGCCCGGIRLSF